MKKLMTYTSIFLLALSLNACAQSYTHQFSSGSSWLGGTEVKASNNYVTKQIKVKDFNQISVGGSLDVTYTYNPQIEMFARFKMKSSFHKTKRII